MPNVWLRVAIFLIQVVDQVASRIRRFAAILDADDESPLGLRIPGRSRESNCSVPHARGDRCISQMDRPQDKPRARDVLRDWARAPGYLKRATEFLKLACHASLPAVRKRYVTIAQHYQALAEAEKRLQLKKSQTTLHPPRAK
jgi:hypothetical protein